MDELISKQAVRELLNNNGLPYHINPVLWKELNELPPAERDTAEWIESEGQKILLEDLFKKGEVWRVCSKCGAGFMIGYKYETDKMYHETFHNFCPKCGADMRGEHYE